MVAHGGESPTRKANARRHVAHATVWNCQSTKQSADFTQIYVNFMKHFAWFAALLAVFFAGDRLVGSWLESQAAASQFRYARLYAGKAKADILLLGNSRGLAFFQPHIEASTGKKTFNLSYNGLPTDAAKALTWDYLDRYPAPEVMVVDITICDRENDELLAGFLTFSQKSARLDDLIHQKLPKVWGGGALSTLFCCNNEIFQRALFYRNKTDEDWLLDRSIAPQLAATAAQNSYDLKIQPYLVGQLAETVAAARAKGMQVELVIGPYFPGFRVKNLDALKQAIEAATGLTVRDYRNALSDPTDFGDFMHPNKKGSVAYMDLLQREGVFGK
jgi:hypothetical protein